MRMFGGVHRVRLRLPVRLFLRFPRKLENVVQRTRESAEGDGAAHQPDLQIPAEQVEGPGLAVREHPPPHRRPHRRLRRVHEPRAGRS